MKFYIYIIIYIQKITYSSILLRRDIMFLLASDIISQTIRGDWCTKYSSPLSIRSLSILGLWRPTSLESPTSNCKMARVLVSINTPLDRLAENPKMSINILHYYFCKYLSVLDSIYLKINFPLFITVILSEVT